MLNALLFLIVGAVAGWAAGQLTKGHGFGLLTNIILGIVGAYVGGFALSLLGLTPHGTLGQLISSIVGAIIVLWVARFFAGSESNA
ncbi:MAG: GlsB/YeaQ/YmgE family stress response membrane protein [Sporomusaceae bacterium]|nr:GlsB/YeaQ/YmgE family stress response membrane protein [Sporomusaceae bacterium]